MGKIAKYDSLLFGYGMTCSLYKEIQDEVLHPEPVGSYLDFDKYLEALLGKPPHSVIWRDFSRFFDRNGPEDVETRLRMKQRLYLRLEEMKRYGFERWVSKFLFNRDQNVFSEMKLFIYFLHNHWAQLIWKGILSRDTVQNYLDAFGVGIQDKLNNPKLVFTTNYDTYLDASFAVQHIHGRFDLKSDRFSSMVKLLPNDPTRFEYKYLFGTSGYEKLSRLDTIKKLGIDTYDLGFFYDKDVNLGNLLIYGMSFGLAEFITDDFLREYPRHKRCLIVRCVDGHILEKLKERVKSGQLNKITVSYHQSEEQNHLVKMFRLAGLSDVTEVIHSSQVGI